jgi:hypothetical protein
MSWADKAKDAAEGGHGNKMAEGYHRLEVVKCVREKKDGTLLESASGPFLLVVYRDETGAEASCSYWITEKAQWRLIRDMARLGVDMDGLDERGVLLEHFLDAAFATDELAGRTAPGYAEPSGQYVNVDILSPDDVPEKFRADCGLTEGEAVAEVPTVEDDCPNGPGEWDGVDPSDTVEDGGDDDTDGLPF